MFFERAPGALTCTFSGVPRELNELVSVSTTANVLVEKYDDQFVRLLCIRQAIRRGCTSHAS